MLYDRDGKVLWLADETGGFEELQPGDGYNGRTCDPGEPDWWVVAKAPDWQPPGALLAAAPQEDSPVGGSFDLGSPGAPDWDSPAKIAGRKKPDEPWSVLTATQEHLDHIDRINGFGEAVSTIGKGVGEAVSKGAEGAGEALGKTWDALTTNEDLHKGVEFGVKAAGEVSKDVAKTVLKDIGYNGWDAAATKGAEYLGLDRTASILGNPAITIPVNKAIGMARVVDDVWNGAQERSTKDLGRRIDSVYEDVYGRKR